jgi:D-alanyl-D-alanine carboxypeptidase (penicillin-binding protein 5/6)
LKKFFAFLLYLFVTQITSVYAHEIPPVPVYTSGAVVLMDAATGLVLYESEANTQMYPASITKIMTALLVLEHELNLTERIVFCDDSVWGIPRNSSHIYMDVGETLSVYEALYALMLESANEVSIALAIHVAGSVEEFVDLMNRRAISLGAVNTHFVNPSGLPARGHVTTAYDMALIMREAVNNPIFTNIISTRRFDIPPTERQTETRHLLNSHQQIRNGTFYNERVIGGKTGWTTAAGHTLVTYANHDGRRLIVSVLQGEGASAYADTTALLDYGFALPMENVTVFDASTYAISVPVLQEINGNQTEVGRVRLMSDTSLNFNLPPDWSHSWLRYEVVAPETLVPPVNENESLGRVAVYVQNLRVGDVPLTARDTVYAYTPPVYSDEPQNEVPSRVFVFKNSNEIFTGYLSFLNNEYVITLAIPLAISFATLLFALIAALTRNKRRLRRILRSRRTHFSRYPHYRYK